MSRDRFPHAKTSSDSENMLSTNYAIDIALLVSSAQHITLSQVANFARASENLIKAHLFHLTRSNNVQHKDYCKVVHNADNTLSFTCTNSTVSVEKAQEIYKRFLSAIDFSNEVKNTEITNANVDEQFAMQAQELIAQEQAAQVQNVLLNAQELIAQEQTAAQVQLSAIVDETTIASSKKKKK